MLTGCVDTGCRLWPHLRRGGWRIKAGAGIIKWGWRWRWGLTLPQCQPSIIIKIPTPYLYILYRSRKDSLQCHYHPDNVRVSAYFLLQKHDWKSEFKSKYYVDHMPGKRRHLWSLHKCYEQIGNSCTSTRQYVWSSNESHAWLQIYLSTKAIVFFPILNNL